MIPLLMDNRTSLCLLAEHVARVALPSPNPSALGAEAVASPADAHQDGAPPDRRGQGLVRKQAALANLRTAVSRRPLPHRTLALVNVLPMISNYNFLC